MALISTSPFDKKHRQEEGLPCLYFDGKTSRPYQVVLNIGMRTCTVKGDGINRGEPVTDISVSEPFAGTSRLVKFSDGAYCEVADTAEFRERLGAAGYRAPVSSWIQDSWGKILVAFILLLVLAAAGYRWGVPLAAEIIAYRVPQPVLSYITRNSIDSLDGRWLFPSELSSKKQKKILAAFKRVKLKDKNGMTINVVFRKSDILGANAFALPDGTILFLDRLVEIAKDNDELIAVYAHEAGHVVYRHSLRQVIQNSAVAALAAVYIGDVSSVVGALTGWILESGYSRDFERAADRYAVRTLTDNRLSPLLFAKILKKLDADHNRHAPAGKTQKFADYVSTHPSTEERVKELTGFMEK